MPLARLPGHTREVDFLVGTWWGMAKERHIEQEGKSSGKVEKGVLNWNSLIAIGD